MSEYAPKNFRKRPVIIEAMQFETNNELGDVNMNAIVNWVNAGKRHGDLHAWHNSTNIFIETLEGTMTADVKDWIIRGVKGEFYPCKPEIFAETYVPVEDGPFPPRPTEPPKHVPVG